MAILALVSMGIWALAGGGQSITALKGLQVGQSVAFFILPALLCAILWYKKDWKQAIGLSASQPISSPSRGGWIGVVFAILLMLIACPGISLLAVWNNAITFPPFLADLEASLRAMEERALELTEGFVKAPNMEVLVANLFVIAILPAFGEELTFRGLLFTFFDKKKVAVWVGAIIFSAAHMQFFGFIPRMLLGALFGYVYLWSGSLWLPIIMHATNNAFAVIMYNAFDWAGLDPALADTFGSGDTLWVGLLSLALTAVGIYFFRKQLVHPCSGKPQ